MISGWNQAKIHDTLLQKGVNGSSILQRLPTTVESRKDLSDPLAKFLELWPRSRSLTTSVFKPYCVKLRVSLMEGRWPRSPTIPTIWSLLRRISSYYYAKTNLYHQGCFKRTLIPGENGVKCSIWQMCPGVAGNENTFLRYRSARNGFDREETALLETRLSLMNRRPGTCGRLVESQKCSQIEMLSCGAWESKPRPLLWNHPLRSYVCWNQLSIESVVFPRICSRDFAWLSLSLRDVLSSLNNEARWGT